MKNNYKIVIACFTVLAFWENCLADTKIGIGSGVSSLSSGYSGVISMPIKLDSYMLIEPYLGYSDRSKDVDQASPDYNFSESKSYQAGVGLYGISKLGVEFELYYGAALAVEESDWSNERKSTRTINNETYIDINQNKTETSGYLIKPTLGVSYLINENFTISLDAGVYYRWGEEKTTTTYNNLLPTTSYDYSESTGDLRSVNTFTQLMFRMMF